MVTHLEEVSFEVVHEQSTKDVTERAEDLTARGVRRIFAIFVKKREVREWSRSEGAWKTLGPATWPGTWFACMSFNNR